MNITEEIKLRIFGTYSLCKMKDHWDEQVGILTGLHHDGDKYKISYRKGFFSYLEDESCIDSLKLILTPLSEVTDEDAFKVADISHRAVPIDTELQTYIGRGIVIHFFTSESFWDNKNQYDNSNTRKIISDNHASYMPAIVDYLRSKGYMVPYMGIDLYEAGIAIKPQIK